MTKHAKLVEEALDAAREAQKRYQEASNLYPVFVPPEVSISAAVSLVVEEMASFVFLHEHAEAGFRAWAEKPHNKKWFRRVDGTPIPNDVVVCITEAIASALREYLSLEAAAGGTRL